ncbi:MAG: hypothetical protein CMM16_00575 [Rhodospirillaceae bacterium]|nr:hypothetical protein [Rhodospirillaceae bacterium]
MEAWATIDELRAQFLAEVRFDKTVFVNTINYTGDVNSKKAQNKARITRLTAANSTGCACA